MNVKMPTIVDILAFMSRTVELRMKLFLKPRGLIMSDVVYLYHCGTADADQTEQKRCEILI